MATYVNNLRLKEIATGDESGTWGTSTNTNLELIGQALGYGTEAITTNADTHATTIADGSADEGRALMLKYTGTLDSTCTITIGPNTVKKVWIIENATSGSQSIVISQGSGDNVTIANGRTAVVYSDGAGSGADVIDALTDLTITDTLTVAGTTVTIGDAAAEDTKLVYDGNAKDFYIGLDDSSDTLVIGDGSTVGTNSILTLTDDSVTVGDGAAVDTKIVYDGNAKDFYIGLDDSADTLVIGDGSTVGTNSILTLTDDSVTIGDGAAVDTKVVFDGNAQDFYIGLDDSADDLIIGLGSTVGTTPAISIDENRDVTFGLNVNILAQGDLRLQDASGGQYAALQAPATIASSFTLTLPADDGDADQVLSTNGSGVLDWADAGGGAYSSWLVKTANFTCADGDQLICNHATTAFTITLPSGTTVGRTVTISNIGAATVTVGRNSQPINSTASDATLLTNRSTQLVYVDSTIGWKELP